MPNRSIRDQMQGTLLRFAQSVGLAAKDDDATTPPVSTPDTPAKDTPKTGISGAADKLQTRQSQIDKQIADAGG